ncbi:MAG: tyrosyl-tRNA synthetase [Thelocarpon impressellum]|nr:MAG: tyrosyl-tRNA synthetase [Thelocarpon impressellum]
MNYLRKKAEAEERWQADARVIHAGQKKSMLRKLEERGYVDSIAGNRDALDKLMTDKRIGAYVGIDPTAPSMHVGHLLPLMTLFWLYVHGYHAVSLLGGATAKIGDPTDRTKSRDVQPSAVRKANMVSMHYQLKKLWANVEQYGRRHGYIWEWAWHRELVNNNAWMNKLPVMELLQLLGPGVRMGTMLAKETVKNKMEKGDGMSFAEFTYPLLQSWDWWYMYQTKGIQVQIGGSDQFGNIVAGIDAVKYIAKNHYDPVVRQEKEDEKLVPIGFTVPLLTTGSGQKFGKSAGNAIWLDKDMTSTFDLYQFFLRSADADVGRYLRLFTFLPLPEIDTVLEEHMRNPSLRKAQHLLAREFVELVHGEAEAAAAEQQHRAIFRKAPLLVAASQAGSLEDAPVHSGGGITPTNAPPINVTLPMSLVADQAPAKVLHAAGLVASRSEGHRLALNQGAYIGSRPIGGGGMGDSLDFTSVKLWDPSKTKDYLLDGNLLVLRVGKWKVKVVRVVSDEEFRRLGLDAPGWDEVEAKRRREVEGGGRVDVGESR